MLASARLYLEGQMLNKLQWLLPGTIPALLLPQHKTAWTQQLFPVWL